MASLFRPTLYIVRSYWLLQCYDDAKKITQNPSVHVHPLALAGARGNSDAAFCCQYYSSLLLSWCGQTLMEPMSRPSCSTSSIQSKHCRWAEFRRIAAYALSPCYRSHLLNLSQREASVCACVRLMSIHTAIQTNQPRLAHPLLAGDPTYPWEELCRASVRSSVCPSPAYGEIFAINSTD